MQRRKAGERETNSKTQFIWESSEWILLQQRADKLVHKAQLLTGAEVQQIRQQPPPLSTVALDKVLANRSKVGLLGFVGALPIRPRVGWSWGCRRRGWRWWRAGNLIEVCRGRAHTRCWWPSGTRLRQALDAMMCIQRQLLVKDGPSPLGETHWWIVGHFVCVGTLPVEEVGGVEAAWRVRLGTREKDDSDVRDQAMILFSLPPHLHEIQVHKKRSEWRKNTWAVSSTAAVMFESRMPGSASR